MEWLTPAAMSVARASAHAALLVPVVLLLQWLLRHRLTARWRHLLWLVVFFRLLLPQAPTSPLGVIRLPEAESTRAPVRVETGVSPATPTPELVSHETPPTEAPPRNALSVSPPPSEPIGTHPAPPFVAPTKASPKATAAFSQPSYETILPWLMGIWLTGAAVLLAKLIFQASHFRWRLHREGGEPSAQTLCEVAEAAERLRISHQRLRVLETAAVNSPAIFGIITPILMLPRGQTERRSAHERCCIFLHELAHVKRHDLTVQWFVSLLLCLHWFNPVLWFAARRLQIDRELATDELALNAAHPEERNRYGETILQLLDELNTHKRLQTTAVGIAESHLAIRSRIRAIARHVPGKRVSRVALLAALAILLTGLLEGKTKSPSIPPQDSDESIESANAIEPEALPKMTVDVEVFDINTRKPIPGALVYTDGSLLVRRGTPERTVPAPAAERTDAQGHASIQLQTATDAFSTLLISAEGYSAASRGLDPKKALTVSLSIPLERARTIRGRVVDPFGQPLPGTQVWILSDSRLNSPPSSPLVTDARGDWTYNQLPASATSVTLHCRHDAYALDGNPTDKRSVPYHRQSIVVSQWPKPRLRTKLVPGAKLRGKIVDEAGNPITGAVVSASSFHQFSSITDATGAFRLPGSYAGRVELVADAQGFSSELLELDALPDLPSQTITLKPGNKLSIRCRAPNGNIVTNIALIPNDFQRYGHQLNQKLVNAEGIWEWNSAPGEPVELNLLAFGGYQSISRLRLQPQPEPHEIQLTPATRFAIDAVDANGRRLHSFESFYRQGVPSLDSSAETTWTRQRKVGVNSTSFDYTPPSLPHEETNLIHEFTIKAVGFKTYQTTHIGKPIGTTRIKAQLELADQPIGILQNSSGIPLGNRTIFFLPRRTPLNLVGSSLYPVPEEAVRLRTDQFGRFSFPDKATDFILVASQREGISVTHHDHPTETINLTLQPWSRLQGKWNPSDPAPDTDPIRLQVTWLPIDPVLPRIHLGGSIQEDRKFNLKRVPPGRVEILPILVNDDSEDLSHLRQERTLRPATADYLEFRLKHPEFVQFHFEFPDEWQGLIDFEQSKHAIAQVSNGVIFRNDGTLVRSLMTRQTKHTIQITKFGNAIIGGLIPGNYEIHFNFKPTPGASPQAPQLQALPAPFEIPRSSRHVMEDIRIQVTPRAATNEPGQNPHGQD